MTSIVTFVARHMSATARSGSGPYEAASAGKSTGCSAPVNRNCLVATSDAVPYQPEAAMGNADATTTRSALLSTGPITLDTVIHPPTAKSSRTAPWCGMRGLARPGTTAPITKKWPSQ